MSTWEVAGWGDGTRASPGLVPNRRLDGLTGDDGDSHLLLGEPLRAGMGSWQALIRV